LVIDGETGWVFPAGDPDALRAALLRALAAGPDGRVRMGRHAQEKVGHYSFDAAAAALRDALASLPVRPRFVMEDAP
jgi:glycosyltransferase involved in cell wall biosynthesis